MFWVKKRFNLDFIKDYSINAFYMGGAGSKKYFYFTPKLKIMGAPNLACGLVFTKLFWKIGFELLTPSTWRHGHFSKNDVIFTMASQALQVLYKGLFFNTIKS